MLTLASLQVNHFSADMLMLSQHLTFKGLLLTAAIETASLNPAQRQYK